MVSLPKTRALVLGIVPSVLMAYSANIWASTSVESTFAGARAPHMRKAGQRLAAGQPAEALRALAEVKPVLGDVARTLTVLAHVRAGALSTAREALKGVPRVSKTCGEPLPDPLRDAARVAVVEALADDAPADAARLAEGGSVPPDLLARIGAAFARRGDERAAGAWFARLLVKWPESRAARALLEREPKRTAALNKGQRAARLRAILEAHDNAAAAREAERWLADGTEPRCLARYVAGTAYRKMRRYRPALRHLERARAACVAEGEADHALRSALLECRVRSIRGEVRHTRKLARWIEKRAPRHAFVDDAWFYAAEVTARKEGMRKARPLFARVVERYPRSDHAPTAAWRLAFDRLQSRKDARTARLLDRIQVHPRVRPIARDRARYWRARINAAAEPRALAELVWPPSFYGWLALDRLRRVYPPTYGKVTKRLGALRQASPAPVPIPASWGPARLLRRAAQLTRAELPAYAVAELARLECRVRTADEVLALAAAYTAAGAGSRAQRLLRQRSRSIDPRGPRAMHRWRLAYSRPFAAEIEHAARKARVEPLLLTALVREESRFDPKVVSWAGATGLAQLMPATAIGAYADLFGGKLNLSRLVEPELNLRLGAHVLGQGMRSFRHPPLALAAYNGGPGLTRRLLPAKATPFELWVEQISVKETRRYVKRVLETWGIYRFLYHRDTPFIDFPDLIRRN